MRRHRIKTKLRALKRGMQFSSNCIRQANRMLKKHSSQSNNRENITNNRTKRPYYQSACRPQLV
ncbi:unnamed protein product, partial [Ceratitis capitata]